MSQRSEGATPRFWMAGALLALLMGTPQAQAQDAQTGLEGPELWNKAGCFACHGILALGGGDNSNPFGPNLRTSRLDGDSMFEVVACGKPNGMPFNLKGAYTEYPCYGAPLGEIPGDIMGSGKFTLDETEALVEFLVGQVVGNNRITREHCGMFFGGNPNAPTCLQF